MPRGAVEDLELCLLCLDLVLEVLEAVPCNGVLDPRLLLLADLDLVEKGLSLLEPFHVALEALVGLHELFQLLRVACQGLPAGRRGLDTGAERWEGRQEEGGRDGRGPWGAKTEREGRGAEGDEGLTLWLSLRPLLC